MIRGTVKSGFKDRLALLRPSAPPTATTHAPLCFAVRRSAQPPTTTQPRLPGSARTGRSYRFQRAPASSAQGFDSRELREPPREMKAQSIVLLQAGPPLGRNPQKLNLSQCFAAGSGHRRKLNVYQCFAASSGYPQKLNLSQCFAACSGHRRKLNLYQCYASSPGNNVANLPTFQRANVPTLPT